MKIEIDIDEYFTPEMIKEIAEDELRRAFRRQFQKESDVERVIANLSSEFVFTLIAEQWDGDFTELLRKKIKDAIEDDTLKYIVFRRKDAWDRTETGSCNFGRRVRQCSSACSGMCGKTYQRISVPRVRQERDWGSHLRCDYGQNSGTEKGGPPMTREEAIKFAEHAVNMTDIPEVKEFYRMSAAALRPVSREQVEKVWRGEWEPGNPNCPICGKDKFDGLDADIWADWMPNFCPYCGSPMTDEAVDMVMERVEALKDEKG